MIGKAIARLMLFPLGSTLVIALLACVFPVRWDIKSFALILPQFESGPLPPNSRVLFVSEDNDWENGHYAQFGLDLITFPEGRFDWMVFKEGDRPAAWEPRWAIDRNGKFYAYGEERQWNVADRIPPDLEAFAGSALVIVRSSAARDQLLERWPSLVADRILVMKSGAPSFWERPRLRVTLSQVVRIFVPVFVLIIGFGFLGSITDKDGRLKWLNLGLVVPGAVVLHTLLVYLLGRALSQAVSLAFVVEFIAALGLVLYLWKNGRLIEGAFLASTNQVLSPPGAPRRRMLLRPEVLLLTGVLIYLSVSTFKLDFDSDVFTQYLAVARYHHLAGNHEPTLMVDRYGLMTQATYPPAFSILISSLLWIGDLPKETPIQFDDRTNLAVFLYRLVISILHLSFLLGVAGLFAVLQKQQSRWGWLLPLGMIPLILPLFLGRPDAAEVYLVPLAGFSILALFAGDELRRPIYTNLGLFFGGFLLFAKKEGLVVLLLIVLPWYLAGRLRSSRFSLRSITTDLLSLFLGLIPFLVWKMSINSIHIPEYFFYDKIGTAQLMSSGSLVKKIVEKGIKILLGNSYWVVLFLFLPLVTIYDWVWGHRWRRASIPVGIFAYVGAMTCVYLFSRNPAGPLAHMDVSYERILSVGVLATILYSARVALCRTDELAA